MTKQSGYCYYLPALFFSAAIFFSCNNKETTISSGETTKDTLTQEQQHLAANALKGLIVMDGLQIQAFATEPMLKNPTNIDVDERGRVWVTEAYNYRPANNNNPTNPAGDRIMILEDTNGDGKADTAKVYYQGPEINAPLGICVLGNKVIISQSPYVWAFYDDNGDDKADRKEIIFEGIEGEQHDHGAHAITFGPDGKFYFNLGNAGKTLKDKNGKIVRDQDGNEITPKKYKEGIVLRCDPDGSHVECLGQNFRNPYEVAVDSYGSLWQSDNDDDGNRGTRINYVMQYGSYGYTDEMTGAGWSATRTNMEDSIPLRHWHLNDPGTIPNLLQTWAGSPTGIIVYEGSLLPAQFHNQIIHCDAGTNVVRVYPVTKNGAGYSASIVNILKGEKDQWFRPADVCVAPDGSLIIADWYDPGVGGHQAGDQTRGRIYRVSPVGSKYSIKNEDFTSPKGAVAALQNPNLSVRYHAFTALQSMGDSAVAELKNLFTSATESRMRARAFWALIKMPHAGTKKYLEQAMKDQLPEMRITAIRAAYQLDKNDTTVISFLVNDPDEQVRRECAVTLHHNKIANAAKLWAKLAASYQGNDRWFLEALGIGADGQWDKFFNAYKLVMNDSLQSNAAKEIIWRARTDKAVPYLAKLASDGSTNLNDRLKYFRAFDFNTGTAKSGLLLKMLENNTTNDVALNKLVLHHLDINTVKHSALAQKKLKEVLQSVQGTDEYIDLVSQYEVKTENPALLKLAIDKSDEPLGKNAATLLVNFNAVKLIQDVLRSNDTAQQFNLITSLSGVGSKPSLDLLQGIALSSGYPVALKKKAAAAIGKSWGGEERVIDLLQHKKFPEALIPDVVSGVKGAWRQSIRKEAESYLPASEKNITASNIPTLQQVNLLKGNASEGLKIFSHTCSLCHKVNETGYDFGPKLSEIGTKLPLESLYEAIVYPSKGISFGYEGWEIKMKDGSVLSGIISSKTETDIDIKFPGGSTKHIKTADVKSMEEMKTSMMPEGLCAGMAPQEMANLLGYLKSLQKK